jgi:hypothetical protein
LVVLVSVSGAAIAHDHSVFNSQITIATTVANSAKIAPNDVK